ncbi:hypothetical protein [Amycolatopsis mediterranei]|nr:hypothetical protein [Amycolatopsis mediterranei]AEK46322.1 hypothetical protein RAM_39275 [Amycolatopsis mediterranei S699]KDO09473.1 hypothetical protein DV26_18135 [Amycolatopsis mediterranei]KDU90647.1 hypothetical protein DV36_18505 [Amycolatopsis mediterranei]UZF74367.1 hypothetical protein ISP_007885 [Amycolatopsis mediterranei]
MDFDTVAGELYGGDLAEFVSARNAAVKAAKAEGDAELAKRIQQLRKPTTAAAIVNGLARDDSDQLRELAELGAELRDAHTRLAGDELRALTRRRGELVRRILHELPSMSDPVTREVEATLEAVAAEPDTAALALAGRLTSVAHQDTDQWFSLTANAPPVTGKRSEKLVEKAEPARPKRDHRRKEREEEQERARARAERERLRKEAAERDKERAVAERDLVRTERAAEQARARVDDLRERLAEAEERAGRATAEFETAKAAYEEADAAAEAARKAADAAR